MNKILEDPFITSFVKFWQRIEEEGLDTTKADAKRIWKQQTNVERLRGKPVSTESISIRSAFGTIGSIQIDLMDVGKYSGYNNGTKFLLNCVDIYSRYAWSFPIKNKKPESCVPGLTKVISDCKKACKQCAIVFFADDGNEFKGAVNKLVGKEDIPIIRTTFKQNQGVVERFNQTLWKIFNFSLFSKNKFKFIDVLDGLIESHNKSVHSTVNGKPTEIFHGKIRSDEDKLIDIDFTQDDILKPGDRVRVSTSRKQFDKGSTSVKFSAEIFEILEKVHNRYRVQKLNGQESQRLYLPREMTFAESAGADDKKREELERKNREDRIMKREKAFQLNSGEKKRLQPKNRKRKIVPKVRYE